MADRAGITHESEQKSPGAERLLEWTSKIVFGAKGMNKACSVCGEGFNSPENSLFICEGRGCHVGVHQG